MLAGIAPAVKEAFDAKVVCSLQGEDYFLNHLLSPHREQALEALRRMAPAVDRFVAPSRDHAEAMAPLLGVPAEHIEVVHPGLSLLGFGERPAADPKQFVIGYLARVAPEKGLHLLAEAFLKIRTRITGKQVRLHVAGWLGQQHRGYLQEVRAQLERAGVAASFEYWGDIDRETKLAFLGGLDVLSVPVLYRAPKGLYVLEAWASGVPVVQPRLGVFSELIEKTGAGLLFEAGKVEELAAGLERLIDNPAEASEMGQRGRRATLEYFHNRRMAEETVAIYEELLGCERGD
jgi:glycosyltransferase involved in cell wall biosynthesis